MDNQIAYKQIERNYGIDLLRIVSMLLVCIIHVLKRGGVIDNTLVGTLNYNVASVMEISAYCAVNCYALISGYVGVKSKFKFSNIANLWLQVIFYSALITIGFAIFEGNAQFSTILFAFLPVFSQQYWYFTAYFGLFFFMPLFNLALNNLNKNILKICLVVLLFLFCFYSLDFGDNFVLNGGYSLLWIAMLYLIGGYIFKYNPLSKIKNYQLILIVLACILFTWIPRFIIESFYDRGGIFQKLYGFKDDFISYTSPTITIIAISLLELFSRMKLNKIKSVVTFFASTSFGVYLIHVQNNIWKLLYNRFAQFATYNPILMILSVLGVAIGIYIICSLIDYLRLLLFRLLKINMLTQKLEIKIKNKFFKEEICLKTTEN